MFALPAKILSWGGRVEAQLGPCSLHDLHQAHRTLFSIEFAFAAAFDSHRCAYRLRRDASETYAVNGSRWICSADVFRSFGMRRTRQQLQRSQEHNDAQHLPRDRKAAIVLAAVKGDVLPPGHTAAPRIAIRG